MIVSKRKHQYEQEVTENPLNYDAWFDYLRLIESEGEPDVVRETYERAIANVPPTKVICYTYTKEIFIRDFHVFFSLLLISTGENVLEKIHLLVDKLFLVRGA